MQSDEDAADNRPRFTGGKEELADKLAPFAEADGASFIKVDTDPKGKVVTHGTFDETVYETWEKMFIELAGLQSNFSFRSKDSTDCMGIVFTKNYKKWGLSLEKKKKWCLGMQLRLRTICYHFNRAMKRPKPCPLALRIAEKAGVELKTTPSKSCHTPKKIPAETPES